MTGEVRTLGRITALGVVAALVVLGAGSPAVAAPGTASDGSGPANSQGTPERAVDKDQRYHLADQAAQGSRTRIDVPGLTEVTSIHLDHPDPRAPGIALGVTSGLSVSVPATTPLGNYHLRAAGSGCGKDACDVPFSLDLTLTVTPVQPVTAGVDSSSSPSDDRLAAGEPVASGGVALRDQLLLLLGTPDNPGTLEQAQRLAASVGAVVTGAIQHHGGYQLRWTGPVDLRAATNTLRADPLVADVARSVYGDVTEDAVPAGDWDDDGLAATWPFIQIRAQQAWDITTGGDVGVGIVDGGTVYEQHEDLNVDQVIGQVPASQHATHVAGLACAEQNGLGVVGAAWGCPISTVGVGGSLFGSWDVYSAASQMSESDVRVVNMSLGVDATNGRNKCVESTEEAQGIVEAQQDMQAWFRYLFTTPEGRDKVWVLSAGNSCSPMSLSPWGHNFDLPNVITVGATNSDGSLSSFSDFGSDVEVVAPGGVSPYGGLWSTWLKDNCAGPGCSSYAQDSGTSMAAPLVTGVAELVRSINPGLSAADAAGCITSTAGALTGDVTVQGTEPTRATITVPGSNPPTEKEVPIDPRVPFTGSIPIVDAQAAVMCAVHGGPANDRPWTVGPLTVHLNRDWGPVVSADPSSSYADDLTNQVPCTNCQASPPPLVSASVGLWDYGRWCSGTVQDCTHFSPTRGPAPSMTVGGRSPDYSGRTTWSGYQGTMLYWCFTGEQVCVTYDRAVDTPQLEPSQAVRDLLGGAQWAARPPTPGPISGPTPPSGPTSGPPSGPSPGPSPGA